MFQGVGGFFAKHAAGQLIRVGCNPKAARMWGKIREKSEPVFLTSFIPLFPSLSLSLALTLSLSPSIMLCRTPRTTLGEGRERRRKKERRKVGQGDLFFFPQFTKAEGGGVIVS